jgi:hypothetical protein
MDLLLAMSITTPPKKSRYKFLATVAIIVLVIVIILDVAYASFSASNAITPFMQIATNPLSPPSPPVIAANTTIIGTTPVITSTTSEASALDQNPAVLGNYNSCTSISSNATVQGYGQLYQKSSGCVMLIVPVMDTNDNPGVVNQYYALHNLPATYPPIDSWVTISGQIITQPSSSNGNSQSCPLSYINVTTVS